MIDSASINQLSAVAKSTFCLNFIKINQPHITFWADEFHVEPKPFIKLSAKLEAYLTGELQSASNLQRFFDEFLTWRDSLQDFDCLAYQIVSLCFSTICAAIDNLDDPECDDVILVVSEAEQIIKEMAELGCNPVDYQAQLGQFLDFNHSLLQDVTQRPIAKSCIIELDPDSGTLFGL